MKDGYGDRRLYSLFQKLGGVYLVKSAIFLPESQRVAKLTEAFEMYFKKDELTSAREVAEIFPEPHRTHALVKIIERCLERGHHEWARRTADMIFENHQK